jgi:lipoyl(octanoyl) transferase
MVNSFVPIQVQDFGLMAYDDSWALQKQTLEGVSSGQLPPTLFVGEHPPVYTTGRKNTVSNRLQQDIPVVEIERGGDITYHGPGQLISYPIFPLPTHYRDLHQYLRDLEEVLILTLQAFGLEGFRNPGWTGVWIQPEGVSSPLKMASIGVAVSKWVTYHGIALNVTNDLTPFSAINPCGLSSEAMTRLVDWCDGSKENAAEVFSKAKSQLVGSFQQVFQPILLGQRF